MDDLLGYRDIFDSHDRHHSMMTTMMAMLLMYNCVLYDLFGITIIINDNEWIGGR
jgi:hypothetical protein